MRRRPLLATLTASAVVVPALSALALGPVPVGDPDLVPGAVQEAAGCDATDPALCLFPFPNDRWTVADPTTDTGLRLALPVQGMPRSGTDVTSGDLGGEGKPIDPTEWNRNDGFSPGSMVLTLVPGLDLPQTWGTADRARSDAGLNEQGYYDFRDQITDIPLSLEPDAPIAIVNTETGERHPFWSELDTHAETPDDRRALVLRPAVNFQEGVRYAVALRDLKGSDGAELAAHPAFAAVRDAEDPGPRMTRVFASLAAAGIPQDDLYQAWDFTVASERNLSERVLHLRDEAFAGLGDADLADRRVQGSSPTFAVDRTEERTDTWTDSLGVERSQRLRRVFGRVDVPNYLDRVQQTEGAVSGDRRLPFDAPAPGSRLLDVNGDDQPERNPAQPTVRVPFTCDVPLDEGASYSTLYGHGLLGQQNQIGDVKWPRRFGFAGCAADWWGMSTPDVPTVAAILADVSTFASLPDRAQQGFLNWMFLGRALVHPQGLVSDPAFQQDGAPLLVTDRGQGTEQFYDGNSQGGIMGGALVALSPDISRGVLGVPGMNYSTLLQRSVDWEGAYAVPFYANYTDPLERQLVFALMQVLWDRGEANGYAAHMTSDPLPGTPAHEVMLQTAFSDHQVANVAAEVMARTAGAPVMAGLPDGRHWDLRPLEPTKAYPYKGSALVYWDSGNATPPNGNVPPTEGRDPHGDPRNEPAAGWQEAQFLLTGKLVDVCNGGPYLTRRHPANAGAVSCVEPAEQPGPKFRTVEGPRKGAGKR